MFIKLTNTSFIYNKNTPFEKPALDNLNLTLPKGEFISFIGHMGSGKSTLLQLLNGIIKPTSGTVSIGSLETCDRRHLKEIRQKVGLVFQYPEHQLFGATVYEDIAFGLKSEGLSGEIEQKEVRAAMALVGLDYMVYHGRNPFQLSGGEQRKVAIAGILVRKPEVLALDEPFAGLDSEAGKEIAGLLQELHARGKTIILVTHDMNVVWQLAKRTIIMQAGKIIFDGSPKEAFADTGLLEKAGLGLPDMVSLYRKLTAKGISVSEFATVEEGVRQITGLSRRE